MNSKIEHLCGKWKISVEEPLIQEYVTLGMDIWVLDPTGRMVDNQPRNTQQWHENKEQNLLKKARITSEYPKISNKN